ncbi:hypothetical protein Vadar_008572 [Vaccinium darrowii]|uniref:Uncharacterized protein n=1 Tax=Vaccinium darrowii TaxID=229202 RepID=A0ACB7X8C4_9ERIC|nr:hypothetical protein Vadar_008572 [Vaccinium darrowii]
MEQSLCEAAIRGDINALHEIIGKDKLILQKVAAGCFNGASPLHVATLSEQTGFVKELLRLEPNLAEVLDSQLRSALHLASAKGHNEIVNELLSVGHEMCLVHDRDGKNPLHVAAMKGRISVLEKLVRVSPQAARVRLDRNETILHLCVKHNQSKSLEKLLEVIQDRDFVNAKDDDGNNILHLAILDKRFEITSHVLEKNKKRYVNAKNATGLTPMDILFQVKDASDEEDQGSLNHIEDLLLKANAKRAKDLVGGEWLTKKRDALMVVASLIATMAFQAGVNPPGGVWQDDSDGHRAGEAVMAYNYQDSYPYFLRCNTIGFVASLSTILLLISGLKFKNKAAMWILIVTMWLAITSMAITYAFSSVVVTPKKHRGSLSLTIEIAVIVWSSVMTLLLLRHTYHLVAIFVKEKMSRMKALNEPQGLLDGLMSFLSKLLCVKDERTTPPLPGDP